MPRRVRPGVRQGNNKKNDRAQRHEERELEGVRDVDGAVGRRVDRPRQAQRDQDVEDVRAERRRDRGRRGESQSSRTIVRSDRLSFFLSLKKLCSLAHVAALRAYRLLSDAAD